MTVPTARILTTTGSWAEGIEVPLADWAEVSSRGCLAPAACRNMVNACNQGRGGSAPESERFEQTEEPNPCSTGFPAER